MCRRPRDPALITMRERSPPTTRPGPRRRDSDHSIRRWTDRAGARNTCGRSPDRPVRFALFILFNPDRSMLNFALLQVGVEYNAD